MTRRSLMVLVLLGCSHATILWTGENAHGERIQDQSSLEYLSFDSNRLSQASIVSGLPLIYTRQFLALDEQGHIVGQGESGTQIERVLNDLESVLKEANSSLNRLVRVNICALSHEVATRMVKELRKRLAPEVKPALTIVLTPLPYREALVAIDAVAAANQSAGPVETVQLVNSDALAGDATCADFAVLPASGVAYLSGQPEKGSLAASAVMESLSKLVKTLEQLDLTPADIAHVKVFLTPATSAVDALEEVKRLFPDQLTPPVVFVEWIASVPVEIELVAQLHDRGQASRGLEFYDPPEVRPSTVFSRVALVRADRQVFISGLSAREEGDGESQVRDVFAQLREILGETQSSMKHLAKATYFVSDDDASRMLTKLRPEYLDPTHPPAASKVTVHGVGQLNRSLTIDIIAVGNDD